MRLIIDQPNAKPAPVVRLTLVEDDDGNIELRALEEGGLKWALLTLNQEGLAILNSDVPDHLGLEVDNDGYLVFNKE